MMRSPPVDPALAGTFAPILTPFELDGGALDGEAYLQQLRFLEAAGLDGVLVAGTNGEFGHLSEDEKFALVETTIAAGSSLKVMAGGTVADSPERTLALVERLSQFADDLAAIVVAPPFYQLYASGGEAPAEAVVRFYQEAAGLQDKVPLLLYNVPVPPAGARTAPVTPAVVVALRGEACIVGIKDARAQPADITAYLMAWPGLKVFVGSDHRMAAGLAAGSAGSITAAANVFPSAVLAVQRAQPGARREAAQAELSRLREVLERIPGKMVSTQKVLAARLGIVQRRAPLRDSRRELTPLEESQVWAALKEAARSLTINGQIRAQVLGANVPLPVG